MVNDGVSDEMHTSDISDNTRFQISIIGRNQYDRLCGEEQRAGHRRASRIAYDFQNQVLLK